MGHFPQDLTLASEGLTGPESELQEAKAAASSREAANRETHTAGSALGLVLEIGAGERIGYYGPAQGGARQGTGTKDAGDGVRDQPRGRGGAGGGDPQAADQAEAPQLRDGRGHRLQLLRRTVRRPEAAAEATAAAAEEGRKQARKPDWKPERQCGSDHQHRGAEPDR